MNNAPDPQPLVRILARYLRDNPNACDSAEGIHRWWLADGVVVTAGELEKALRWMKQTGLIEETVAADGRVRFRRSCDDAQLDKAAAAGNGTAAAGTP